MTATILHGDCINVLRTMPYNSVDAICCDPPYGLSNTTPDKVTDTIVRWATGDREAVPSTKAGFMGAEWDAFVPPPAVWDECFRVLKPGGHLLAFAGARTQDLMGISVRMAGFDIRDSISWINGAGFPKSLDISKAIDKARDDKADILRVTTFMADHAEANGVTRKDVDEHMGTSDMGGWWLSRLKHRCQVPKVEQWLQLKAFLNLPDDMDAEVWRLNGRKGTPGENWGKREVLGTRKQRANGPGSGVPMNASVAEVEQITKAHTPEAEKWKGWGTSLKPAVEPVIVARKPLSEKTVAANTLTWGTGGLNIDKTRIGTQPAGRWPANVVLDPDTAKALDQQSGTIVDRNGGRGGWRKDGYVGGTTTADVESTTYRDKGGASRFFKVVEPDPPFLYAAKAPKRERPRYEDADGNVIQHPTCKPLSIMKWLIRLTCPEGGTVLDPFAGSGTTVEAALLEGFDVIGIEREEAYLPLIQQRIDRANDVPPMAS